MNYAKKGVIFTDSSDKQFSAIVAPVWATIESTEERGQPHEKHRGEQSDF